MSSEIQKFTGSCMCGKVRFEYEGLLGPVGYCHCDDCRKITGSAFNVSLRVDKSGLRFLNDEFLKSIVYTADSGKEMSRHFCSGCGSPIMTLHPEDTVHVWIKAGVIDQPEIIKPVQEAWTSTRVSWADINVDKSYPKNPG